MYWFLLSTSYSEDVVESTVLLFLIYKNTKCSAARLTKSMLIP